MRSFAVTLHRWAGLYMAFFLIVAGVTGAILAFHEPIGVWLSPDTKWAKPSGPRMDALDLYQIALSYKTPELRLDSINLESRTGKPVYFLFEREHHSATDGSGKQLREVRLNPYTGEVMKLRYRHQPLFPITRENLLSFIYALHFSLALPGSWGIWLFGIAALIWTIDCFVGVYLTFPLSRRTNANFVKSKRKTNTRDGWFKRWYPSWIVRWKSSTYKLNFDLHRAGSLWIWMMLLIFAWSSVHLNLNQIYKPVMNYLFDMSKSIDTLPKLPKPIETPSLVEWKEALAQGRKLAKLKSQEQGFDIFSEKEISIDRERSLFRYNFTSSSDIGKYGHSSIFLDAKTKDFILLTLDDQQNMGVQITNWIVALHFAAVWGMPMQIFISIMGIVVAMLSVTGVIIWWRKRKSRRNYVRQHARIEAF